MNRHSRLVATVIVLVAAGALAVAMWPHREKQRIGYFTIDDGATTVVLPWKPAPFDYQGQPAVEAVMYACDGSKFVGYLLRYTPDGQKKMAEWAANPQTTPARPPDNIIEVKRPGIGKWCSTIDPRDVPKLMQQGQFDPAKLNEFDAITAVKCPNGTGRPINLGVQFAE